METTNTTSNIQKKMLTYARDIALEKLNKKLDKKLAKQQIRKKEHENILYQRCSQNSDMNRTSSEFASSSSDITPPVQSSGSSDKITTSTSSIELENSSPAESLLSKNIGSLGQSVTSIDSNAQEDDYQTADEDEPLPTKKDVLQTVSN